MLDSISQWLVINSVFATWAAVVGALISSVAAVVVSAVNALIQLYVTSKKSKVDRSGELIDEFFSDQIYEARRKLDKALKSSLEQDIDNFSAALDIANKKNLARLMHYFEKLEGLVASKQVHRKVLKKTMSNKISWWFVYLIERFEKSENSEWHPLLLKLKRLRALCTRKDYHRYKNRKHTQVRARI